jgi:hypothetical protein
LAPHRGGHPTSADALCICQPVPPLRPRAGILHRRPAARGVTPDHQVSRAVAAGPNFSKGSPMPPPPRLGLSRPLHLPEGWPCNRRPSRIREVCRRDRGGTTAPIVATRAGREAPRGTTLNSRRQRRAGASKNGTGGLPERFAMEGRGGTQEAWKAGAGRAPMRKALVPRQGIIQSRLPNGPSEKGRSLPIPLYRQSSFPGPALDGGICGAVSAARWVADLGQGESHSRHSDHRWGPSVGSPAKPMPIDAAGRANHV